MKMYKYAKEYTRLRETNAKALGPVISQSTRALLSRVTEDFEPSEGIYYCVRDPGGWNVFSYRYDEYGELDHVELWESFAAPVVAARWSKVLRVPTRFLEKTLVQLPYAFPRGRVILDSPKAYAVRYGLHLAPGISKGDIVRLFSLNRARKVEWNFDDHEQCQVEDRDAMRKVLKLEETWPAV